jgi:hypothetical protein
MIKDFLRFMLIAITISNCVPVVTTSDNGSNSSHFSDKDLSNNVGIVRFYVNAQNGYGNPIINMERNERLVLKFDLLENDFRYMNARIFHCNADWKKSGLNEIEYLNEYNEIPINNYQFSEGNLTPYVSYSFEIPRVTRSGNYAIGIFDDATKQLLFTRRFMVLERKSGIVQDMGVSNDVGSRMSHQQLEFSITYSDLNVLSPMQDIKVTILQNHNWNIALTGLTPRLVRMEDNYLEYRHFDLENNFAGLNEFRYFDIRVLGTRGNNIERVGRSQRGIEVFVQKDKSKKDEFYSEPLLEDLNGGFYLSNIDINEIDSQSEYAWVNFKLETSRIPGEVYVTGRFNNWSLNKQNMLSYDESAKAYTGSVYLKQGFYNYMYWVKSPDIPYYYYEGSHFQARNEYEILVYFREPGKIYDRLVGYTFFYAVIKCSISY